LYNKKYTFIVYVIDAGDRGPDAEIEVVVPDMIISYAIWKRDRKSKEAHRIWAKKNSWLNVVDSMFFPLSYLNSSIYPHPYTILYSNSSSYSRNQSSH